MEDRLSGGVRVMRMRTTLLQREKIIQLYWTIQKEENWGVREMKEGGGGRGDTWRVGYTKNYVWASWVSFIIKDLLNFEK